MKQTLFITFFVLAFFISTDMSAQKYPSQNMGYTPQLEPSSKKNEKFSFPEIEKFDGTYQFIIKQKTDFLITSETFQLIENNRKETEDVTITLSDYLDVFIPSKQTINQPSFKPLTKTYIFK
ncbi:MAG: hypothetical protein V4677_04670 [Bacteroidota bacterium]